ncbi:hypothetical protein ES703_113489 [subsurface metagenome]
MLVMDQCTDLFLVVCELNPPGLNDCEGVAGRCFTAVGTTIIGATLYRRTESGVPYPN